MHIGEQEILAWRPGTLADHGGSSGQRAGEYFVIDGSLVVDQERMLFTLRSAVRRLVELHVIRTSVPRTVGEESLDDAWIAEAEIDYEEAWRLGAWTRGDG